VAKNAKRATPVALTIAGSDNSAGAGIQADLKSFSHFGVYGLTAITCVVAEIPGKVTAIQPVKPEIVGEQIALSLEAFPVGAVKTGMLYSTAIIEEVAENLDLYEGDIVVDPVMVATSGDPLLKKSAIAAYESLLLGRATLVTPNLDELAMLSGRETNSLEKMKDAGRALVDRYGTAFLLKGGHLRGRTAIDFLATEDGFEEFAAPFVPNVETHGTGCTYSSAIAANLAKGLSLSKAVATAKDYITAAIRQSHRWNGVTALRHFPA